MSAPLCRNCYTRPDDHVENRCPTSPLGYNPMSAQEFHVYQLSGHTQEGEPSLPFQLLNFMVRLNFGSKEQVALRVQRAVLDKTLDGRTAEELLYQEKRAGGRWLPCTEGQPSTSPIPGVEAWFVPA